jgi:integrase
MSPARERLSLQGRLNTLPAMKCQSPKPGTRRRPKAAHSSAPDRVQSIAADNREAKIGDEACGGSAEVEHPQRNNATSSARSVDMLMAVVEGRTYESVADEFGISRTAVERRVKNIALRLTQEVGVEGLNEGAAMSVWRLRRNHKAIVNALGRFDACPGQPIANSEVFSDEAIALAVHRIRGRSSQPMRDLALFYMLFATGARPLEVARLGLRDYLNADGSVRRESELPAEAATTRKSRPLYFASSKLDEALSAYLGERLASRQGLGDPSTFRGLNPASRLFLTSTGNPFPIKSYGTAGQQRYLCRAILETYRKLFRYAELEGATALSVRRTFVARLYDRGADEDQIGMLLGIGERRAVREQFPRTRPTMARLVQELV